MKKLVLGAISFYQRRMSPGMAPACRFQPTCSQYAYEAVERYGPARGIAKALWRLLRCNPLNDGGFDPVEPGDKLVTHVKNVSRETSRDVEAAPAASRPTVSGPDETIAELAKPDLMFQNVSRETFSDPARRGGAPAEGALSDQNVSRETFRGVRPSSPSLRGKGPGDRSPTSNLQPPTSAGASPLPPPSSPSLLGKGPGDSSSPSAQNVSRETFSLPPPSSPSLLGKGPGDRSSPSAQNVSRETFSLPPPSSPSLVGKGPGVRWPGVRSRRRLALPAIALASLALLAVGCGLPPGPSGWAPAVAVQSGSSELVLVTHKSHIYALPAGSSNATWQFPPSDKNGYPVSESAQRALNAQIDGMDLPDAGKSALKARVADVHVAGPSISVLKDAVSAAVTDSSARSRLNSQVDAVTKVESGALGKVQAVYGDIGISTDKKTAYFGTFKGFLFAIDITTGHLRWLRDEAGDGIVGGIAVDDGSLYYGTKGKHVFALDAETGGQKWVASTTGEVWATPVLAGNALYVTSLDGSLYALDKTSGSENWRFNGAGSGVAAKPLVSGDSVYVGAFDDKLYSVKVADGSMNWSVKAGNWFWATPVLSGGIIYAASLDGKVYAVDANTGASRWDRPFDTGAAVRSTPVVAGGGLIAAARDGKVFKLDLATGKQSDASPVVIANAKILADLTTDTAGKIVYIVPDSATLFTIDAANLGPPGSVPLPQ